MPLKRAIDIVGSGLALLLGLPLLVAIAAAVAIDSGFPVYFRQRRVGRAFRQFHLLKFRSMVASDGGPRITVSGDRRVTRVGRFLRATKLDELPQFWNVLTGDMSLVGPRPELPEYVEMFRPRYQHILSVRPGITDIASIRFRDEEKLLAKSRAPLREYVERVLPVKLDLADEYLQKRSLRLDLLILAKTALVTLPTVQDLPTMFIKDRVFNAAAALELRERFRRPLIWGTHLGLFLVSGVVAFLLRFDFSIPASESRHLLFGLAVWLIVKSAVFRWLNLDRGWWRFVSIDDVRGISLGNFIGSLASSLVIRYFGPPGFPRSIYFLDLVVCLLATSSARVLVRILRETVHQGDSKGEKQTLIYGAGAAGLSLLREIRANPKLSYAICGYVDDDHRKARLVIQGVRVLGTGAHLSKLVTKHRIEAVLIAVPAATGSEMTRILRLCQEAGVTYKTVPGLGEIIEGNGLASQIRDVAVEDLLGRKPVRLEEHLIRANLEGKIVLVTGAAGSIGSELCRQITRFHPAGIIGFDIAESPLFDIDREMRQAFPDTPFYPEIGSIQNRPRLDEVLRQYSPSVIYHAAAYKHVPLMEAHVFEATENNVFGTYNLAVSAAEHGVEDFVMISSDKAVRPTNVMGATKRVAELLLLALQNGRTKYVAVRFGNVLGSNGSVIPIFKKQIAAGGPVTVTHPDMRRFFMTIPEACQLVLQASIIGERGQICVLDMGEPVKIVDLARNLILLSGLRPDEDIKIAFTGMRPGEKLYEELTTVIEDTAPTTHEKIRIFVGNGMPEGDMLTWLDCLREICETRDAGRLIVALKEIVLDYSPSAHLLKRVIEVRDRHAAVTVLLQIGGPGRGRVASR